MPEARCKREGVGVLLGAVVLAARKSTRGRVMSLYAMMFMGMGPLGAPQMTGGGPPEEPSLEPP